MDSLDQQQLKLALSLTEIIHKIDIVEAASILASFDWNINKALATIDLQSFPAEKEISNIKRQKNEKVEQKIQKDKKENAQKQMFQQQKQYNFQYKKSISAILKRGESRSSLYNPQKFKESKENTTFLSYLRQKYKPLLNFSLLNFSQSLLKSFNQSNHLLVYIHFPNKQVERTNKEFIRKVLCNPISSKFVNKNCVVFGSTKDSLSFSKIQKYSKGLDVPFLALFKYNYTSKTEDFLSIYSPEDMDNGFQFLDWISCSIQINLTENQVIQFENSLYKTKKSLIGKKQEVIAQEQLQMNNKIGQKKQKEYIKQDEKAMKKDHSSKLPNKSSLIDSNINQSEIFYDIDQFPQSLKNSKISNSSLIKESVLKNGQSRNIRQQQDRLYSRLQKSYLRKRQMSQIEKIAEKTKQQNLIQKKIQYQAIFNNIGRQASIKIKFRLPNGENKQENFNKKQKIQNIFLFVDCHYRDSFQYKFSQFQLNIPFEDKNVNIMKDNFIEQLSVQGERIIMIVKQI